MRSDQNPSRATALFSLVWETPSASPRTTSTVEQPPLSAAEDKLFQFAGKKHISLETYRKTGDLVRTPVWFVEENGELFVRTDSDTGKIKRIRNNPRVRVAPCNMRGTVKSDWVEGEARTSNQNPPNMSSLFSKRSTG